MTATMLAEKSDSLTGVTLFQQDPILLAPRYRPAEVVAFRRSSGSPSRKAQPGTRRTGTELEADRMRCETFAELIDPTIMSTTRADFLAAVRANIWDFEQRHIALTQLLRGSRKALAAVSDESFVEKLKGISARLVGDSGPGEVDFCIATMRRAARIASRFDPSVKIADDKRDEDSRAATLFSSSSLLYAFGTVCLLRMGQKDCPTPSREAMFATLEIIRAGALQAYIHARAGKTLRAPPSDGHEDLDTLDVDGDLLDLADKHFVM